MITHNMREAIQYGNRLIMMHAGESFSTSAVRKKQNLTVEDLLHQFERAAEQSWTTTACFCLIAAPDSLDPGK